LAGVGKPAAARRGGREYCVSKVRIVSIIDDHASARVAIEGLVRSLGFVACAFQSAEDFLRSPRANETSCLITDVQHEWRGASEPSGGPRTSLADHFHYSISRAQHSQARRGRRRARFSRKAIRWGDHSQLAERGPGLDSRAGNSDSEQGGRPLRRSASVRRRGASSPFDDGCPAQTISYGKRAALFFRCLELGSNSRRCAGAAMKNACRSASSESRDSIAS
jgi:hypothetical protein